MLPVLVVFVSYLLGSIPFGLLLGLGWKKTDVRQHGSKNIGAANVTRTLGKTAGALTLLLDASKGAAGVILARMLDLPSEIQALAAFAAILGHVFPLYLKFKGGKGVAVGLGVFLALAPMPTAVAIACFILVMLPTRIVSLSSMVSAASLVVATWFLDGRLPIVILAGLLFTLVLVRHRSNIVRLVRKTEPTI